MDNQNTFQIEREISQQTVSTLNEVIENQRKEFERYQMDQKKELDQLQTELEKLRQPPMPTLPSLPPLPPLPPVASVREGSSLPLVLSHYLAPIRMTEFGGYPGENVEEWIIEARGVLQHEVPFSVFKEEPMLLLRQSLKHEAQAVIYSLSMDEVNTPDKFFKALRLRFGENKDRDELEKEYRRCTQEINENVTQYEQRLRKLAHQWNPKISEWDLISSFRSGLRNLSLRHSVGHSVTLNEAFSRAKNQEGFEEIKRKEAKRDKDVRKHPQTAKAEYSLSIDTNKSKEYPTNQPYPNRIQTNELPPNYPFAPHQSERWPSYVFVQPPEIEYQKDAFYLKPGQHPFRKPGILGPRPPKKDLDCWFCGKIGHFARDCRSRQQNEQRTTDNNRYKPYPINNPRGNSNYIKIGYPNKNWQQSNFQRPVTRSMLQNQHSNQQTEPANSRQL